MRDNFGQRTIDTLAARAGSRCSNPACRQLTSGPRTETDKAVNIGVAAHITAASPSGPRYDPGLTPKERRHPDNGLWLCQNCAKLVDNDPAAYPTHLLRAWKRRAEEAARQEVEQRALRGSADVTGIPDDVGPVHIGGGIQAGQIQANNIVSGIQIVGGPPVPQAEDLRHQGAALREQVARELAVGNPGDETAVGDGCGTTLPPD